MTTDVGTLLDNMQAQANFAESAAANYWSAAMAAIGQYNNRELTIDPLNFVPMNIGNISVGSVPSITAVYEHKAVKPDMPELEGVSTPDGISLPVPPTISIDTLFAFAQPELNYAELQAQMPEIDYNNIDSLLNAIEMPTLAEYQPPILSVFDAPVMPTVTVPTFSSSTSITSSDPGLMEDVNPYYQAEYEDKLLSVQELIDSGVRRWISLYAPDYEQAMNQLEAKLADGMERGTGLPEEYENNLYTRARGKAEREFARSIDDIENGSKRKGFFMPTGAMLSSISNTALAVASSNAESAISIAIEKAKMEVQHIQFVLSTSAQVRQSLQNAFLQYAQTLASVNGQSIEAAKNVADNMLKVYSANLDRHKSQMEILRTEAAIYETQLKAALAQLDVYKLEIEGAKLQLEGDQLQVENYSKLIAAEQLKVELSIALLKSVETRAGVEKMKIEAFAEQARAYSVKLGSDELRVKVYTALLEGDKAKLQGRLAELDVYEKVVDANVKRYSAEIEESRLDVQKNQLLLESYKAELDAFKTETSIEASIFESGIKGDLAKIEAYKQSLEARIDVLKANIQSQTLVLEGKKATLAGQVDVAELQTKRDIAYQQSIVDLDKAMAQTMGDIAKAALSGINGMASEITQV